MTFESRLSTAEPPPEAAALVESLRLGLAAAADPVVAPGMQAYMRSMLPYRGVRAPACRKIFTAALDAHPLPDRAAWLAAIGILWDQSAYREERYHPAEVGPVVRTWATDEDRWLRRTAVICQVGAKERTDVDLLAHAVDANLDDRDFFLRKAIGWALRQHARTDPAWVRSAVAARADRLSPLSRREALKHLGPEERLP